MMMTRNVKKLISKQGSPTTVESGKIAQLAVDDLLEVEKVFLVVLVEIHRSLASEKVSKLLYTHQYAHVSSQRK